MTASTSASMDDEEKNIWEYVIKEEAAYLIPLSQNTCLELIGCLHNIHQLLSDDITEKLKIDSYLNSVVTAIVMAGQGDGERIVHEVMVKNSMLHFDKELEELLNGKG